MDSNKEDIMSEFSYTQSENLNLSSDEVSKSNARDQSSHLSNVSSTMSYRTEGRRNVTGSSMEKNFEPFAPMKAPLPIIARDSYDSSISEYSGGANDIAESVSVHVINQDKESSVNRKHINSRSTQEIVKSSDSGSLEVGKLETSSQGKGVKLSPQASFNTSIDAKVPPRSPRRPRSEIILESQGLARDFEMYKDSNPKSHKQRFSLNISDDLDKLMDTASMVSQEVSNRKIKPLTSNGSQDAESDIIGSTSTISQIQFNDYPFQSSFLMDKDSSDDLYTTRKRADPSLIPSPLKPRGQSRNSISSYRTADIQKNFTPDTASLLRNDTGSSINSSVSSRFSSERSRNDTSATLQGKKLSDASMPLNVQPVMIGSHNTHSEKHYSQVSEPRSQVPQVPQGHRPFQGNEQHLPRTTSQPRHFQLQEQSKELPQVPSNFAHEHEDDYSDIEEPVTEHRQSKSKSTKESSRKSSKTKRSRSKKGKSVSSQLKPFSYSTLINLLESMNGTIIGEEFSQLDLPLKEKQLIEKIIDSLSRLTSDMVVDEKRYEIGLVRLENALRVLEGFM